MQHSLYNEITLKLILKLIRRLLDKEKESRKIMQYIHAFFKPEKLILLRNFTGTVIQSYFRTIKLGVHVVNGLRQIWRSIGFQNCLREAEFC